VQLDFATDAVAVSPRSRSHVNERQENIGARRLHTVLERLLDNAQLRSPASGGRQSSSTRAYVDAQLGELPAIRI
jgi:ATP-dependent HslUV protease ATP-binding subunit HslU